MSAPFEQVREPTLGERLAVSTRVTCRLATKVIAVSKAVRDELVQLGIDDSRVLVRNNPRLGVSIRDVERSKVRHEFGYADSDIVAATVGHAVPVKGWDILLRAFNEVSAAVPAARLLLIGSTSAPWEKTTYNELLRFVESKHLGDKVRFIGHIGDVARPLAAADLFVLPSRSEGFSFALVEALEAGLPCVATRVGIAEEAIRPGINGLLVPRDDEEQLTRAVMSFARDEGFRAACARNARVPASIPTLEDYAESIASDYESMLAGCDR